MTTAIGKMNIEYLKQPDGIIHEFVTYLASNADRIANSSTLGFYHTEDMNRAVEKFFEPLHDKEQMVEVSVWVESPFLGRNNYLALAFNW